MRLDAIFSPTGKLKQRRISLLGALAVLAVTSLVALGLAGRAHADTVITESGEGSGQTQDAGGLAVDHETGRLYVADRGNHRVSVFAPGGEFVMAWGWGVIDGSAELQVCTVTCRKGLPGGGAGQLRRPTSIAVDNDPASPSHHAVYVMGESFGWATRVQKFGPSGEFLGAWGRGVIEAGASGIGTLTAGSTTVANAASTSGTFDRGQAIEGAGISAGTKVVDIGAETLTLSQPATASGTDVVLNVPEGPGHVPTNERVQLSVGEPIAYGFRFRTPEPSVTATETPGQILKASSSAAAIQKALEDLANINPGDVAVSGPAGGPFVIEFKGPRFSDTDIDGLSTFSAGGGEIELKTLQNGGGAAEICTPSISGNCAEGVEGFLPGEFTGTAALSAGPAGTVYVVDSRRIAANEVYSARLQKLDPDGTFIEETPLPGINSRAESIMVNSSGDLYTKSDLIRKYDAAGNLLPFTPISGVRMALDPSDNLFVTRNESSGFSALAMYDDAGNPLRTFGYDAIANAFAVGGLAAHHSPGGEIYASIGDTVSYLSFPPPGPIVAPRPCEALSVGNTSVTLRSFINPEGQPTTVHFEYVDEASFEKEGGWSSPNVLETAESESVGAGFELVPASEDVTVIPEESYRCRVVASNSDGTDTGLEGAFTTLPPLKILATWSSQVGAETAQLNATVNPLGIPARAYFEYVVESEYQASGFAQATRVPSGEETIALGAGEDPVSFSVPVAALTAGTRYRYRVVATDPYFPNGISGPVRSFSTPRGTVSRPDGRSYELVSASAGEGAEVGAPPIGGVTGLVDGDSLRVQAASPDGEAMTFTSFTSFGEDAQGAAGTSQYLARRGTSGWVTENISPYGFLSNALRAPYRGLSPDLSFAGFVMSEPPLTPDAVKGVDGLYLRNNSTGELRALVTELPQMLGSTSFCTVYAGASADGQRAYFAANGSLAGAPKGAGYSLYEWSASDGLDLVSILPGEVKAPPSDRGGFGAGLRAGNCGMGSDIVRNAISADGSRIFWTSATNLSSRLFARIDGTESIQLDAVQGGAGPAGDGTFWAASTDGSKVFFTTSNPLVPGANSTSSDLYLYDFDAPVGSRLSDLTSNAPANVQGVLGASEDGSHVYFAAAGALAPGAVPTTCGQDAASRCNLYLWRAGAGLRFIAPLAGRDASSWSPRPSVQTARVTEDGLHLAFLSRASLTDYDNEVDGAPGCVLSEGELKGDAQCTEAYLYDAVGDELRCVSCNPTGARPIGPTELPTWTNPLEGPRYLSEDGRRVFFQTQDALDPEDKNGLFDVYEFERAGTGSCNEASPSFAEESDGCLYLISTGQSEDHSYLLDASADGRDVFFATRQILLTSDPDNNYDVYDYRVGGFPPPAPDEAPCSGGESCRPPAAAVPEGSSPATPNWFGPGNVPERIAPRCPKGKRKLRRGGRQRCVKRAGQRRNHNKRRAAR